MEETPNCPQCHTAVKPTDFFCYNCGKNLQPKPLATSLVTQLPIYIGSIVLPPIGIIWGVRYLRQKGTAAKVVGLIAIILTIVTLVVATLATIRLINTVNEQVNSQIENLQRY